MKLRVQKFLPVSHFIPGSHHNSSCSLLSVLMSGVCDYSQRSSGSAQGQLSLTSLQEEFNEAGRPNHPAVTSSGPVTVTVNAAQVVSCVKCLLLCCWCHFCICVCGDVV